MGRFQATVPFYARTRPPYGTTFFATVAARLGLTGRERLLDLGVGPGLLGLGFAPFVAEVVGVDPEPAMLAAARAAAAEGGQSITLVEGRAETLDIRMGPFDLVTIGRALHWMERAPTCATLDGVVAPDGVILVRNPWLASYDHARKKWTSESPKMSVAASESFFDGTRFVRAGAIVSECKGAVTVGHLVDRVLSMSSSSRDRVGANEPALRVAMATALEPFARNGLIKDVTAARAEVFASGRGLRCFA